MGSAGLRAADPEHLILPVQIVQSQAADFPGPQPVSDEQHQDRPVALVDRTISLQQKPAGAGPPRASAPFGTVSSAMNRGAMIPAASPGAHQPRVSAKQEERPQALRVIVYRPAAPGSPPVLCRDGIVDVGHPDGVQRNAASRPARQKKWSAARAIVLYGRLGKAALLAQPFVKDLRPRRHADGGSSFGFVEPAQESAAIELRG